MSDSSSLSLRCGGGRVCSTSAVGGESSRSAFPARTAATAPKRASARAATAPSLALPSAASLLRSSPSYTGRRTTAVHPRRVQRVAEASKLTSPTAAVAHQQP